MKLSVLFVDDDAHTIDGIRRMMHAMRNEWGLLYANGGKDAIDILEQNQIDVIISDIRMPGVDGTELLTHVKENYPYIVRITLSGFMNDNLALRNTRIVHQSLSKPTTPEKIKKTIEKAHVLRKKLNNDELLTIINGIENLPSLPKIYLKLEEEMNSPSVSVNNLSKIVSNDPIVSAKILQLTNSAFFGLPNRISNIKQALNVLGTKLVQNLVLSIKLFRSIDPNSPKSQIYEQIWNHSNKVAYMSRQIAKIKNLPTVDLEDYYLGGLLHDIGKVVILENISENNSFSDLNFTEYEKEFSNTTHADIGAYLLGIWGLPDSIVEAVAFHHDKEIIMTDELTPAIIVNFANKISKVDKHSPSDIDEENISEIINDIQLGQFDSIN